MKETISGVTLELLQGDISAQEEVEAVVNAANAQLRPGGGVAGAIHRAAGPGLDEECRPLAPIKPGQAVITGGHQLPNQKVIHCLGPVYGKDKPEEELLASCYREALKLAEENGVTSVAFPSISSGAFGYPTEDAAEVAIKTILEIIPTLEQVKKIRFVLYSQKDLEIYQNIFTKILESRK